MIGNSSRQSVCAVAATGRKKRENRKCPKFLQMIITFFGLIIIGVIALAIEIAMSLFSLLWQMKEKASKWVTHRGEKSYATGH